MACKVAHEISQTRDMSEGNKALSVRYPLEKLEDGQLRLPSYDFELLTFKVYL